MPEPTENEELLSRLVEAVVGFRDERNWGQFHNTKDLMLSLMLEASELAELSQWREGAELDAFLNANRERVEDELSDVFYWVLLISHQLGIDLGTALRRKLSKNAAKYPIDKAFGRKEKYNELT